LSLESPDDVTLCITAKNNAEHLIEHHHEGDKINILKQKKKVEVKDFRSEEIIAIRNTVKKAMNNPKISDNIQSKMKEILDKRDHGERDLVKENKVIANKYSSFQEMRRGEKMIDLSYKHLEAKENKDKRDRLKREAAVGYLGK